MTTWPFPDRPGVPPKDGPYWLQGKSVGDMQPVNYEEGKWFCIGTRLTLSSERVAAFYNYLGPCLTPEEVATKDARIAELEEALQKKGCARNQNTTQFCAEAAVMQARIAKLTRLVEIMIENDPEDMAADAVTVLDVWRKEAREALGGKDE